MKKVLCFLLALVMSAMTLTLSAQETLTVAEGNATNTYIPVYGLYCDAYLHSQIIYPESMLQDMVGSTITSMTFYANNSSMVWENTSFEVKVGTTSSSSLSSSGWNPDAETSVYSGTLSISNSQMRIEFEESFPYAGDNLIVEILTLQTGTYHSNEFVGLYSSNGSAYGYSYSSAALATPSTTNFIPKTTFEYSTSGAFCAKPKNISFSGLNDNSVLMDWIAGGEETEWEIYVTTTETDVPDENTAATYTTYVPSYSFSGLTTSTKYYVYLRSACAPGFYSGWKATSFMTSQVPAQLPYLCDFEDADENSNWSLINDGQTNQWFIGNATNHTDDGENGLYISDDNGITNQYTHTNSAAYAYRDIQFPESTNDFIFSCQWKNQGESQYYESLRIYIGSPEEVTAGEGNSSGGVFTQATLLGSYYGSGNAWNEASFLLPKETYANNTFRIYFFFYSDNSGGSNPPAAIDDINIKEITCPTIDSVVVENITSTAADFTAYTPNGQTDFMLYYKLPTDSAYTEVAMNTAPFTLDNLVPGSVYKYYMKSDCGNEDYGFATPVSTFMTQCATISTFPWTESFESYWEDVVAPGELPAPLCWFNFSESNYSYYYWAYSSSMAHTGNGAANFYGGYYTPSSSYSHNDWLVSPVLELTGNERVNFFVTCVDTYYGDDIAVYVIDENDGGFTSFNDMQSHATCIMPSHPVSSMGWEEIELSLMNYEGNYRLAFVRNGANGGANMYLDDITVSEMPACPKIYGVTVDAASSTSALLTFRNDSYVNQGWEIAYDTTGSATFDPENAENTLTIPDGATLPITLDNLATSVEYTLAIRQSCGGEWSDFITFTLPDVDPVTVPFTSNFEDTDINDAWVMYNSTSAYNTFAIGNAVQNGGDSALYISNDNGTSNQYSTGSSCVAVAAIPVSFGNADQYVISFDWKMAGESNYDFASACLVPMNVDLTPTDSYNQPAWVGTYKLNDETFTQSQHSDWTNCSVIVDGADVNGSMKQLAFVWRNDGSGGSQPPVAIDNISILEVSCPVPSNVTVSNITTTTADVAWTVDASASTWIVQVGQNGTWENYEVYENPYTIENLNPSSQYHVRVATLCGTDTSAFMSPVDFFTNCAALQQSDLPYLENFNSTPEETIPNCWRRPVTYLGAPYVTTTTSYTGSNSIFFQSQPTHPSTLVTPQIDVELNNLQVTFTINREGESSGNFEVGVMSDPTNMSTFEHVASFYPPEDIATEYTVKFDSTTLNGPGNYIAFRQLSVYDNWYYWLDDVEIAEIPVCPRPESFTFSNLTTESVTLTWHETGEATSWNILYGPAGFDIESDGTLINVYDTTEFVENLTTITYDFYVQADCGSETSIWRGPLQITPGSFNINATGTDTVNMCGGIIYDNGGQHGQYTSNCNSIVVVNPDAPGMLVQLSGTYYLESHSWDKLDIYDGVGTSGELLWSNPTSTSNGVVPTLTSSTGSLTISFITDGGGVYDGFALQVACLEAPSCLKPANLTANTLSSSEVSLSWVEYGTANAWNIEYGPAGFTPGAGTTVGASTNPFTVTGLDPATTYEFYIQADCGGGDVSEWNLTSAYATTECLTLTTFPYTEDFESTTGSLPDCWSNINISGSTSWEATTNAGYNLSSAHSGSKAAFFYQSGRDNSSELISPTFDLTTLTNPTITFWYANPDWGGDVDA
ncbi:MAG: choice-of-anchor J domain-containing protein, partial [Bacteroidales bacterium]|nr:choice-of-anchor J domain-containing protein [Bacteroidales bacterium]